MPATRCRCLRPSSRPFQRAPDALPTQAFASTPVPLPSAQPTLLPTRPRPKPSPAPRCRCLRPSPRPFPRAPEPSLCQRPDAAAFGPAHAPSNAQKKTESALDVKDPARRPLLAAPRASAQRQRLPRRDQEPAAPTPQCLPGMSVPPPGALPLSRGAHPGAAGQRKTSTTTARLSGATIPSRR